MSCLGGSEVGEGPGPGDGRGVECEGHGGGEIGQAGVAFGEQGIDAFQRGRERPYLRGIADQYGWPVGDGY